MEKRLYKIGDVADIMGISVQTLRHYCNMHIIEPEYVDSATGYRYFSYEQFPYIDRTRYLLQCGLTLKEIRGILKDDNLNLLRDLLSKKAQERRIEIKTSQDMLNRISWYMEYFLPENLDLPDVNGLTVQFKTFPERYLIAVPCGPDESYEDIHIHLQRVCHSQDYADMLIMRQFCTFLDYQALMQGHIVRKYLGMYIKSPPKRALENIIFLPPGDYLCFRSKIFSSDWKSKPIQALFENRPAPAITIANEFENSFHKYDECVFDVQFLIS